MRETEDFYFFWKHQFGQWTMRDMYDVDGVKYNCCEQFMMHKKALLFSDKNIAKEILESDSPSDQQKMGRKIKGFDAKIWDANKLGIVWYGNYLKFSQHDDLKDRLIKTNNKILVEASPYDTIWGVGLGANNDKILDKANWRGLNLLGQTLMLVRSSLSIRLL